MSVETNANAPAVQNQQLLQMLMDLSKEEIVNLRRLLQHAEKMKQSSFAETKTSQHKRRFIDPNDGGPVWELDFVDDFDRAACYENFGDET